MDPHRLSAARALRDAGFAAASPPALRVLQALAEAHSNALVRAVKRHAHLQARAHPNAADVHAGLVNILGSEAIAALFDYSLSKKPHSQGSRKRKRDGTKATATPSSLQLFQEKEFPVSAPVTIPPEIFLPPFPSIHTYKSGEISGHRESDIAKLREIKALRAREVDANLRRLLLARENVSSDSTPGDTGNGKVDENDMIGLAASAVLDGPVVGSLNYRLQRVGGAQSIQKIL
ncbi:hypothetical protein HDU83_004840 [Entophlyctis luteolus]|nr:hypothetical protein HDU83_004840 [Entophlyctis luteolus]